MSNFKITFSYPWLLLLIIPAIAFALIPYFRISKKYRRNRNRVISVVLHCLIMTLCVSLLSGIMFLYEIPNRENEIILLVDCSFSGSETEDEKNDFIQSVVNDCKSDFKLGIVKFGYDQKYVAPLSYDARDVFSRYLGSEDPDISATDFAGALKYASGLFTNPKTSKIVIISDGIETDDSAATVIKSVSASGIKVDVAYFPDESNKDEVQIIGAELPDYNINVGEEFNIGLTVQSNYSEERQVSVTIYDTLNGSVKKSEPLEFTLTENIQTLELKHSFDLPGMHELRFEVTASNDAVSQNNAYYSYVYLKVFENILMIERYSGESEQLKNILDDEYKVDVVNIADEPDRIPSDIYGLCEYDQVILVNVSNADIVEYAEGFDELLYNYVYNLGGGLFTVGGNEHEDGNYLNDNENPVPHAYNRDDMLGSVYQQMLPVQVINYTPPVAVMIIIDHSGSMGSGANSPVDMAKKGALTCLDALSTRDYCGVMTLDSSAEEKIQVTPVSQSEKIRDAINNITSEGAGSTIFYGPILQAGNALAAVDVEKKHIIIITDGDPSDKEEFLNAVDINTSKDITMSVIAVQSGYVELMEEAAERGNGKCYDVRNNEEIATLIYEDLVSEAIAEIVYGEKFTPKINDRTSVVAGIDQSSMPSLYGYYGTRAKEGADVPLIGDYVVPVYAQWKFGEGMVGSFMCDLNGVWSCDFIDSAVGMTGIRFINNVVENLFPTKEIKPNDITAILKEDNYTNRLNVYTELEEGQKVQVTITAKTEEANAYYSKNPIAITVSDDYSGFTFAITYPGLYEILIEKIDADGETLTELTIYKTFSYSQEYNSFPEEDGGEFLASLARDGKGIVIEDSFDIFESFIKTIQKTFDPRWLFLILTIVFFLLDVAVRKFKFKWPHELIRDYKEKKSLMHGKDQDRN